MGNVLVSRKDYHNRGEEEFPGVADIERGASPTCGSGRTAEIETIVESERAQRWRILHRVPPQVREKNKHIYEPLFVSFGPYHHGQPQTRQFEAFKDEVLKIMLKSADKDMKGDLRGKILERVDEIRSFYGGMSKDEYDDEALAEMMLRDACMLLYFIETVMGNKVKRDHAMQSIGGLRWSLMSRDYHMLENQIPWWLIKLLISLKYDDEDEGRAFIFKVFSYIGRCRRRLKPIPETLKRVPWEKGIETEPLHFLEANRNAHLNEEITSINTDHNHDLVSLSCPTFKFRWWRRRKSSRSSLAAEFIPSPFRSATELKAKGIHFRPSSYFLNDISFSSYSFWGVLHLPLLVVDRDTIAFFSNIIVMEMSPGSTSTSTDFAVTSYVNFMKSLIASPKDVAMLQENGILLSDLEDNEQIVRIFKEIDTHGLDSWFIFEDVKMRINKHCDSKAKTWIAELINTYFRNPWTAITLFAATFLLCLTLLQTYYTINPRNIGN